MKAYLLIVIFIISGYFIPVQGLNCNPKDSVFNIRHFGAKGDGKTINTEAINKAIAACIKAGGRTVVIPPGTYLTGTIQIKSHITLLLEKGAIIKGISDLEGYISYIPTSDMSKYGSAYNERWNKALLLGIGVTDVTIMGDGIIDGDHVFDPQGEERMRGPHAVIFAESSNISFIGITINNASNYAIMAYELENTIFQNLTINQGWDGIHIRGGKNIIIRNCEFYTGDDSIAGGYWENMVITNCKINSSCNGIRLIMPADGLVLNHCSFNGPGRYPHRTSNEEKRTNMLSAIILQPGAWGKAPGNIDKIHIHDIQIDNMNTPLSIILNEENNAGKIVVERMEATNINAYSSSIESWKGGIYEEVVFNDISIEYLGNPNALLSDAYLGQPHTDARDLPCLGFFIRNVKNFTFRNVNIRYTDTDPRPAMYFDNVGRATLNNVTYPGSPSIESLTIRNSGTIIIDGEIVNMRRRR